MLLPRDERHQHQGLTLIKRPNLRAIDLARKIRQEKQKGKATGVGQKRRWVKGQKQYHGRLPVLAKVLDGMRAGSHSQLQVCLGLDKETTGTLLLARTEEALGYVQNLHKNNQVERKYWCVDV
ncbi:unnamed protein product [Coregonus sp. 'balchen']|nr:unnamed protein product [Coregonus sp. 'balchen']